MDSIRILNDVKCSLIDAFPSAIEALKEIVSTSTDPKTVIKATNALSRAERSYNRLMMKKEEE